MYNFGSSALSHGSSTSWTQRVLQITTAPFFCRIHQPHTKQSTLNLNLTTALKHCRGSNSNKPMSYTILACTLGLYKELLKNNCAGVASWQCLWTIRKALQKCLSWLQGSDLLLNFNGLPRLILREANQDWMIDVFTRAKLSWANQEASESSITWFAVVPPGRRITTVWTSTMCDNLH